MSNFSKEGGIGVPESTRRDTTYCVRIWKEWCKHRQDTSSCNIPPLSAITASELQYWLTRFITEVRKKNAVEYRYPPNTLLHICTGIIRYLRNNGHPSMDIFKDEIFAEFRVTLDAEVKRLTAIGLGSKKRQAEPLSEENEEQLWEKGLLGDHNPVSLLNTIVFMNGLYFALRSGSEHRNLRFASSQLEIVEREGEWPYVLYTEDSSKNHPAGLKGRNSKRKVVKHHNNVENAKRCFVRLLQKYKRLCPPDPKRNSFYLRPLKKPTDTVWFSREPIGHNKLSKIVGKMCSEAGIEGFSHKPFPACHQCN